MSCDSGRAGRGGDDGGGGEGGGGGDGVASGSGDAGDGMEAKQDVHRQSWKHVAEVPGLMLMQDIVSAKEECALLKILQEGTWCFNRELPPRKVMIFGPWRRGSKYSVGQATEHPVWAQDLARRIDDAVRAAGDPELCVSLPRLHDHTTGLVFVNEYTPSSARLKFHVDSMPAFQDVICGVSLGAPCVLSFVKHNDRASVHDVLLPSRSLYVMAKDARCKFLHGIRPGGFRGKMRVSLTFRTLRPAALID